MYDKIRTKDWRFFPVNRALALENVESEENSEAAVFRKYVFITSFLLSCVLRSSYFPLSS